MDVVYCCIRQVFVGCQAEILIGIDDVNQVVGNLSTFLGRRLGGADVQVAVHLAAIGTYDFSIELPAKLQG
ncbi:MAG: hypothetical protein DDT24_00832 [Chloroflexi bacterium]|nr:hypothetical protein [Chloroflexota bacterium]